MTKTPFQKSHNTICSNLSPKTRHNPTRRRTNNASDRIELQTLEFIGSGGEIEVLASFGTNTALISRASADGA